MTFFTGNGTDAKLRRVGQQFGDDLAAIAREFNDDLKIFREKVANGARSAGTIVPAVSQAHLTALEARVFFNDIGFLTTVDDHNADDKYRQFIQRYSTTAGIGTFEALLVAMLMLFIGIALGFFYGWKKFNATPAEPTVLAIMQYPWAADALLWGGVLFLFTGLIVDGLFGLFSGPHLAKARKAALDSVRSAYTAQEAPLVTEVVRQVEDVVEILRASLGGGGSNSSLNPSETLTDIERQSPAYARQSMAAKQNQAPDGDGQTWRGRDSSVRFVETSFTGSPKTWRTDAYAKKFTEKSTRQTRSNRRDPQAKRDV